MDIKRNKASFILKVTNLIVFISPSTSHLDHKNVIKHEHIRHYTHKLLFPSSINLILVSQNKQVASDSPFKLTVVVHRMNELGSILSAYTGVYVSKSPL